VTGQALSGDDDTVVAVLRLADLAGKIERVEGAVTARVESLARDCAAAHEQVDGLHEALGGFGGRAEGIEQRLAEVSDLLGRLSGQISALAASSGGAQDYQRFGLGCRRCEPPDPAGVWHDLYRLRRRAFHRL